MRAVKRAGRIARAVLLLALCLPRFASSQPEADTSWTPELIPEGCPEAPPSPFDRALAALQQRLEEARDDDAALAEALAEVVDFERGFYIASNVEWLGDGPDPFHRANGWVRGATLRSMLLEQASDFAEHITEDCSSPSCRLPLSHAYSALQFVLDLDTDRWYLAGHFTGDSLVSDEREAEVDASESAFRAEIRRLYDATPAAALLEADALASIGARRTAVELLERVLEHSPESPGALIRLARLARDDDEARAGYLTRLRCDRSRQALRVLIAASAEYWMDDDIADSALVEVLAGPPADVEHLRDYLPRFAHSNEHLGRLVAEEGLSVFRCGSGVWDQYYDDRDAQAAAAACWHEHHTGVRAANALATRLDEMLMVSRVESAGDSNWVVELENVDGTEAAALVSVDPRPGIWAIVVDIPYDEMPNFTAELVAGFSSAGE